jgi:nucleoid-associated protein YgaU
MLAALIFCMAAGCDFMESNDIGHPLFKQGKRELEKENYAEAIKYFQKYLRVRPDSARIHLILAGIYDENLDSQINAIYHYQEFMRLSPDSAEAKNAEKWLATAKRKYYVKMKTKFNDPEIVASLQDELAGADIRIKKLVEGHNKMVTAIEEDKKNILQLNNQLASVQSEKEKFDADLTISLEKQKKLETENKRLQQLYNEEAQKFKNADGETARAISALNALKTEHAKTLAALEKANQPQPMRTAPAASVANIAEQARAASALAENPAAATAKAPEKTAEAGPETLPEEKTASLPSPESVSVPEIIKMRFYTVKPGDTLSKISKQFYGASKYYKLIQDENKAELGSEIRMMPGQALRIPPLKNN